MHLMYSKLLGLREVDDIPSTAAQGTFVRYSTDDHWHAMVLHKNRYGRNIDLYWVSVSTIEQLPTSLKVEALLLGIQL